MHSVGWSGSCQKNNFKYFMVDFNQLAPKIDLITVTYTLSWIHSILVFQHWRSGHTRNRSSEARSHLRSETRLCSSQTRQFKWCWDTDWSMHTPAMCFQSRIFMTVKKEEKKSLDIYAIRDRKWRVRHGNRTSADSMWRPLFLVCSKAGRIRKYHSVRVIW